MQVSGCTADCNQELLHVKQCSCCNRIPETAGAASAAEMAAERERASVHTNIEDLLQRLNAARLPGIDTAGSPMCVILPLLLPKSL